MDANGAGRKRGWKSRKNGAWTRQATRGFVAVKDIVERGHRLRHGRGGYPFMAGLWTNKQGSKRRTRTRLRQNYDGNRKKVDASSIDHFPAAGLAPSPAADCQQRLRMSKKSPAGPDRIGRPSIRVDQFFLYDDLREEQAGIRVRQLRSGRAPRAQPRMPMPASEYAIYEPGGSLRPDGDDNEMGESCRRRCIASCFSSGTPSVFRRRITRSGIHEIARPGGARCAMDGGGPCKSTLR